MIDRLIAEAHARCAEREADRIELVRALMRFKWEHTRRSQGQRWRHLERRLRDGKGEGARNGI